jgi:hypothetical protein
LAGAARDRGVPREWIKQESAWLCHAMRRFPEYVPRPAIPPWRRYSGSWHVPRPAEICRAPAPTAYAPAGGTRQSAGNSAAEGAALGPIALPRSFTDLDPVRCIPAPMTCSPSLMQCPSSHPSVSRAAGPASVSLSWQFFSGGGLLRSCPCAVRQDCRGEPVSDGSWGTSLPGSSRSWVSPASCGR